MAGRFGFDAPRELPIEESIAWAAANDFCPSRSLSPSWPLASSPNYRRQNEDFIAKLSPLERFLAGEQYDDVVGFQPDGGANPLRDWCKQYDLPTARHYGPDSTINNIY